MTDDIQKVREAHVAALREVYGEGVAAGNEFYAALAKRLQPRPEPVKKMWSVSEATQEKYRRETCFSLETHLNAISPDIIRDRPDLVAADWERRYRLARDEQTVRLFLEDARRALFPELDP